jgi:predicted tellurium resistance membrane protein TerC
MIYAVIFFVCGIGVAMSIEGITQPVVALKNLSWFALIFWAFITGFLVRKSWKDMKEND